MEQTSSYQAVGYRDKSDFLHRMNENYDNIKEINSGGGGIIYSAIHRRLGQKVILKKIRSDALDIVGKDREIQILVSLKHTYLPRILDFWSYNEEVYTVMEFIEGESLKECIDKGKHFSQREVYRLTQQLAEVLVYLHTSSLRIVHSDIKPANIMLTPEGNICLIDFNVSVLQNGETDETIGYTPGYAPIEQLICYEQNTEKRRAKQAEIAAKKLYAPPVAEIISSTVGDDCTMLDDDRAAIDDDRTMLDDDRTTIDDDRTMLDDDHTSIDADSTNMDWDPAEGTGPVYTPDPASVSSPSLSPAAQERARAAEAMIKKYGKKMRVDERSDIYSACATMYQLLTGQKPKPCYMTQIPIEKLVPNVDDAFARILAHGMEQNPAKRYRTAEAFLKALKNMARANRRYKRLKFSQDLTTLLTVAVLAGSIVCTSWGAQMKLDTYTSNQITEASQLYQTGDYQGSVKMMDILLTGKFALSEEKQGNAYYLIGNCLLQTGDFSGAVSAFQSAIIADGSRAVYYRDYGIALVRIGEIDRASECLDQVKAKGIDDDSLLLLDGEIKGALQDHTGSITSLRACIDGESDEMIKLRAGLALDEQLEMYRGDSQETLTERIDMLESVLEKVPTVALKLLLYERLVQANLDCAALTGAASYTEDAIEVLDAIIDSGYSTLTEWLNKAVCLQSIGEFEEAVGTLLAAAEKYPKSYEIYKRLAFLEIERQYSIEIASRDYGYFHDYHNKCMEIYNSETHTDQDVELIYLEQIYKEVVDKGWLKASGN